MLESELSLEEMICNDLKEHKRTNDLEISKRIDRNIEEVRLCVEHLSSKRVVKLKWYSELKNMSRYLVQPYYLSNKAREILKKASESEEGGVFFDSLVGSGETIQIGEEDLISNQNKMTIAKVKKALQELIECGHLINRSPIYGVSGSGYLLASII